MAAASALVRAVVRGPGAVVGEVEAAVGDVAVVGGALCAAPALCANVPAGLLAGDGPAAAAAVARAASASERLGAAPDAPGSVRSARR